MKHVSIGEPGETPLLYRQRPNIAEVNRIIDFAYPGVQSWHLMGRISLNRSGCFVHTSQMDS